MAEYIEREPLLADYDREHEGPPGRARELIANAPAADVAPVRHGLWLTKEYMYGDPAVGVPDAWVDRRAEQSDYYAWCSLCGGDAPFTSEASLILSDWCPSCGANMMEVSHE